MLEAKSRENVPEGKSGGFWGSKNQQYVSIIVKISAILHSFDAFISYSFDSLFSLNYAFKESFGSMNRFMELL